DLSAFHAFMYDLNTGVLTDIGTLSAPGAPQSFAYGVNNDAIVVGTSSASGALHPFAYDGWAKVLQDLGPLGPSNITEAQDINESGITVGFSQVTPEHAWQSKVHRHY